MSVLQSFHCTLSHHPIVCALYCCSFSASGQCLLHLTSPNMSSFAVSSDVLNSYSFRSPVRLILPTFLEENASVQWPGWSQCIVPYLHFQYWLLSLAISLHIISLVAGVSPPFHSHWPPFCPTSPPANLPVWVCPGTESHGLPGPLWVASLRAANWLLEYWWKDFWMHFWCSYLSKPPTSYSEKVVSSASCNCAFNIPCSVVWSN